MAAVMERMQLQIKETGVTVTVPSNPVAKLMYYFDCICSCIEPDDNATIRRLRNYKNYSQLTGEEEDKLLDLCISLSPDVLKGVIFHHLEQLGSSMNKLVELSAVKTDIVVTETFFFGGQQRRILKIMFYKKSWIGQYYTVPLRQMKSRRRRANSSCTLQ